MKKKKLTLSDIAAIAGVSKSTVSFVMNGHAKKHRINEQTVQRITAIVEEHNYKPSTYARALTSKSTFTVGLVIPDLTNLGFATTAKLLERLFREKGYQLLIAASEDNPDIEKHAIETLIDRQVDALLVATSMTDEKYLQDVRKHTPVLLFDRELKGADFVTVKSDQISATQRLVSKLAKGAEECFYIGGQLELSPSTERLQGYKLGMQDAQLELNHSHIFHKDYQPISGYESMREIHTKLGRLPKAIFTASFTLLEGVLRYLSEHDELSNDVRLATFDNSQILDCLPFKIDSIEQNHEHIAQTVFELCLNLIEGKTSDTFVHNITATIHNRR